MLGQYNEQRLHSAIGYVTPKDKLEGREEVIQKERDKKLGQARLARKLRNHNIGRGLRAA